MKSKGQVSGVRGQDCQHEALQRKGLLAKIHVAKSQMGLTDDEYGMILHGFKVNSAADLTIAQMENCVKLMKHYGWKQIKSRKHAPVSERLAALRSRCEEVAMTIENGRQRLPGLTQKICGVSALEWCRDAAKLERLLAVLGKIKTTESATKNGGTPYE